MPPTTGSKTYRRGDVVLVPFPFTDLTGVKQRPALIAQTQTDSSDLIVVAITSQIPARLAASEIAIPAAELALCGLPKASIVRTGKIFTIHEGLIRKRIGSMSPGTLDRILAQLRSQFA